MVGDHPVEKLQAENVLCRRYFHPGCHRMEPYRSYFPNAGLLLPVTEALSERIFSLPTGTAMTPDDIAKVVGLVRTFVSEAQAARRPAIRVA